MPSPRPWPAALALLAALASAASGAPGPRPPLEPGEDAPPLIVDGWVRGEPLENFDRGRVYVVDLFAAGSGACRATIPHLNALAERHPAAAFVGVALRAGRDPFGPPQVEPAARLARYRIAIDRQVDGDGAMHQAWLSETPLVRSRPFTFIVDADGRIAWAGSPMRAGEPLARVLAGTYDAGPARREAQAAAARRELRQKIVDEFGKALQARNLPRGDDDARVALAEQVYGKHAETADIAQAIRFRRLMTAGQYDEAYLAADAWAAAADDDPQQLNELAWFIVDEAGVERRDLARARRYAERAVELSDSVNAAILDTLAKAIFLQGDAARAIELQTRSIELADEEDQEELRATLQTYKTAAATRPAAR